MKDRKAQRF